MATLPVGGATGSQLSRIALPHLKRDTKLVKEEEPSMAHSTMLHVRVDDEIKTQASEALAAIGLSVSDAVRILLKRVVNDQAFPLELKVPNARTRAAIEEARAMTKARSARFNAANVLLDDLEKAREQ
jgi:DNA-damage-inducible protein J